jgi:hypothetical protein
MKSIIDTENTELPYVISVRTVVEKHYNPKYGDDRICKCSHEYYRHFDTYENMHAIGCKYCPCSDFEEKK